MRWLALAGIWLAGMFAAVALGGCGGTTTVTRTVTVFTPAEAGLGPPKEWIEFGHILALTERDGRYLMQFDPAWFLSGLTARKAAAEDRLIEQGAPMPNDNYRVEEGDRAFTYIVAPRAKVTVVTNTAHPGVVASTPIDVTELVKIVDGTSTMKLFEPLYSGVWIRIRGDHVVAIDHQYQP